MQLDLWSSLGPVMIPRMSLMVLVLFLSSLKIWLNSRESFDILIALKNVLRLEWLALQYFLVSGDGRARQVRIVISSVLLNHRVIESFEHKLTLGG